ncbi:hypothetical protein ANANG_G00287910 [Anguilla anguilla]|uniref:Suppressor of cytokine signaling 1 n=1 Tax=Anguilla anguilla TaxID=7936 RepID=A0A9D3RIR0_ANGAN|nr:hypothetical protein ANANG_G00287910 [Anguilla anguilla]
MWKAMHQLLTQHDATVSRLTPCPADRSAPTPGPAPALAAPPEPRVSHALPPLPQREGLPPHHRHQHHAGDQRILLGAHGGGGGPRPPQGEPLGTFLVRDSRQKDVFFTLSYRSSSGPVSIRIIFQGSRFSLTGSKETFDSLFKLLEHYSSPRKSLTRPYRKVRLRSLQELCRQRIVETWGGERIHSIPVNPILKDFLLSFPFRL